MRLTVLGSTLAVAGAVHTAVNLRRLRTPPARPPAPTDDMKPSTLGSFCTISAAACWCFTMASKLVPAAVSVDPESWRWSSVGMNPFGAMMARTTVPMRISRLNAMAMGR